MSVSDHDQDRQTVLDAFDKQIGWCEKLGSPFTARLLTILRDDIAAGGASAELALGWPGDPVADALALRMAGALHALALTGSAPALVPCYPPSAAPVEPLRPRRSRRRPRASKRHSCFSCFAPADERGWSIGRAGRRFSGDRQETGLPLRCLEIGASAGLNTIWDRYHYRLGAVGWGDPQSPVSLAPSWEGPSPPVDAPLRVIERHACDIAPVDLEDPAQRLRLRAYIWADQRERLSRLESAIDLARAHGPRVQRADAADWVRTKLREPAASSATVLYHSIMWQYHAAGDSGGYPRESRARRRSSDQRRAFGLVALRAVKFRI